MLLEQFTTDLLKKNLINFVKDQIVPIFLNVQQQIEKLRIKQTSLFLNQNVNIDAFDVNPGHQCTLSDYKLCGRFRNI